MEFWGAEVKSGEPFLAKPGEGRILHLSQASLGEVKKDKGKESVFLHLKVDGKKLVLGSLNPEKLPQQLFDLVFDKNFELSHNCKNGSVYFYGYTAPNNDQGDNDDSESDSEDEEPLPVTNNGKQEKPSTGENSNVVKDSGAGKKVRIVEPKKDLKAEEDEDSSDDSDAMSEDDSDSEEDGEGSSDDEDEDDDSDEDEDEETPKKVESSKKRPSESASKTPVPSKKAKVGTPQKTDGKKGGVHVATPHPAKKAGKTPAAASTSNNKSPKSEGSHSCKTCNRSFKSDVGLDSHNKAKHSSGK